MHNICRGNKGKNRVKIVIRIVTKTPIIYFLFSINSIHSYFFCIFAFQSKLHTYFQILLIMENDNPFRAMSDETWEEYQKIYSQWAEQEIKYFKEIEARKLKNGKLNQLNHFYLLWKH